MIRHAPDGSIWIPRPNPDLEAYLDNIYVRVPGELRWVEEPSPVEKVKQYLTARFGGEVSEEEFERRLAICEECPGVVKRDTKRYCGLCGCGVKARAELHKKLKMAKIVCPLKKL